MADEDQAPRVWWSRLVRDADQIVGPARAVCWFLADVADKNGASWYGQKKIALHAGVTDRTVRNVLDDLVSRGVIRVDPPADGHRCPTTTLIAAGLERWKGIPVRAESGSTQRGKGFRPNRKRVPVEAETDSYEVPKKSPEEDPKEVITEDPTAREPTAARTDEHPEPPMPPDDLLTGSPTDPDFLAALDHVREVAGPMLARLAKGPTGAHNIGASYLTGSKPMTDTDPIDNDGDKTHPPEASAPSLPSTDDTASATTPATAPPAQDPWGVAPCGEPAQASAYIWLDKPEPAPKRTPKSKPKAKGKTDDSAILAIAAQVDRMKGRTGAALPGSGRWKMLVAAVNEAGADRVLARVTAMADAAQGLPSPASAIFAQMSGSDWGTDPILRGNNGWTVKLDDAIEAAESRSDASQASGGVVGRLDPQGQTAPKQNGSSAWDDMLSVIRGTGGLRLSLGLRGSTLSHDPAEHARRCRAVADIGGWAKLCELNDFNRMAIRAQWVAAYDRVGVVA